MRKIQMGRKCIKDEKSKEIQIIIISKKLTLTLDQIKRELSFIFLNLQNRNICL
ncbi:unnamed protein product [Paramecium sonneborni]|uniref:Uncharacterized protein n=1 Tax=Paramecium sonneborni TaxID=65129 RepID=A0A8S1Q424_9CILI|nr:unnamed protein product [Paramecium sonneborni]